jgi:GT2 family glycosyltransferase
VGSNIAILIIFFNRLNQTIECVESFLPSDQNIYVLNNGSNKKDWQFLTDKYRNTNKLFFFSSDINLGPAKGRNFLLEKCKEEWIFLVDNDIYIKFPRAWKEIFDKKTILEKEAFIFCPTIYNVHEKSIVRSHCFAIHNKRVTMEETTPGVTNYFPCCGAIIHRKIFKTYGNFDDELFAFEDYEFSIRAMLSENGPLRVFSLPEIELIHDHQEQKKNVDKKAVFERYNEDRINASMQHLSDKHQIIFDHEWQWWTRKQVADMGGKTLFARLKFLITQKAGF